MHSANVCATAHNIVVAPRVPSYYEATPYANPSQARCIRKKARRMLQDGTSHSATPWLNIPQLLSNDGVSTAFHKGYTSSTATASAQRTSFRRRMYVIRWCVSVRFSPPTQQEIATDHKLLRNYARNVTRRAQMPPIVTFKVGARAGGQTRVRSAAASANGMSRALADCLQWPHYEAQPGGGKAPRDLAHGTDKQDNLTNYVPSGA